MYILYQAVLILSALLGLADSLLDVLFFYIHRHDNRITLKYLITIKEQ